MPPKLVLNGKRAAEHGTLILGLLYGFICIYTPLATSLAPPVQMLFSTNSLSATSE